MSKKDKYFRPPSPASADRYEEMLLSQLVKVYGDGQLPMLTELAYIMANAEFRFDNEKNVFQVFDRRPMEERSELTNTAILNAENIMNAETKKMFGDKKILSAIRIYNKSQQNSQFIPEERYYTYSPLRFFIQEAELFVNLKAMALGMLIDEVVRESIDAVGIDIASYQRLQPKISKSPASTGYLRDYFFPIDGRVFQVSKNILQKMEEVYKRFSSERESCAEDLIGDGFKIERVPFVLEGGNCIVCEDKNAEPCLLIAISEKHYSEENAEFIAGFIEEDSEVVVCPDYNKLCSKIIEWGKSIGHKVFIIERNITPEHTLADIYHLDTFCNVVKFYDGKKVTNILVIPTAAERVIKDDNRVALIQMFGAENVIEISCEDRKKLSSNFIQFGNNILFSHPETSQELVDKFTARGFCAILPPFILSMGNEFEDGIRCHTQIMPKEVVTTLSRDAARVVGPQGATSLQSPDRGSCSIS